MDASWLMTCGESCIHIAASANLPITVHLRYPAAVSPCNLFVCCGIWSHLEHHFSTSAFLVGKPPDSCCKWVSVRCRVGF